MLRKRAVALAISLMFPVVAPALGLGTLKASSALNQPFEGKIEILGAQPGDFDALTIKLADTGQFDRAGLARDAVLLALKFEVVSNPKGNDYIRVFTRDAVREPYLDFLVEFCSEYYVRNCYILLHWGCQTYTCQLYLSSTIHDIV
jgi:pilus assembly protein FimV